MFDDRFNFNRLKDSDLKLLDQREWKDIEVQTDLFNGQGRKHVRSRLEFLGMGIANDEVPLETGLLQSILTTRAVTYARPPTRQLIGYAEAGREHRKMTEVFQKAAYDAFLRELDVRKVLWRTCIVRFYWSARKQAIVPRMFGPTAMMRSPGSEPDSLGDDQSFAIHRGNGDWEVWSQDAEGWSMALHTSEGAMRPMSEQPFADTDLRNPYPVLPAVVVFDGYSDQAYLPVPSYRTAFALGIATASNEIMEAIRGSSRKEVQYEQLQTEEDSVDPKEMPKKMGHGIRPLLPKGVQGRSYDLTPALADSLATIESLESQWLRAEGIDPGFFRKSQSITAAGLRVLQAPLRELQERLRPWAIQTEKEAWRALRAVHNYHQPGAPLADAEIDVQLAPLDVPMDPAELSEAYTRSRAAGVTSVIDHIQVEWNVGRDEAIDIFNRISQDGQRFPVMTESTPELSGPNQANPSPERVNPAASVVDNLRTLRSDEENEETGNI